MHCKSCSGEVPSLMKHALALNQCPYCGDSIFDKSAGALIFALKKQTFVEDEMLNDQIVSTVLDTVLDKFDITPKQVLVEESTKRTALIPEQASIKRSEVLRTEDNLEEKVIHGVANIEDLADLEQVDLDLLNAGIPENQKVTMKDVARAKELKDKVKTREKSIGESKSSMGTHEKKPIARRG